MATQEERLETLENGFRQFRTETIKAYQDVAVELAMIKGLAVNSVERLKNVRQHFDSVELRLVEMSRDIGDLNVDLVSFNQRVDNRFEAVDKRFDSIDQRFEAVDKRFEAQDKRLDSIDQRLEAHDRRFDSIDQRLEAHDRRFDSLDNKFDQVLSMLSKLMPGQQQGT